MSKRMVAILAVLIGVAGSLYGCAQLPSNECAAITHEQAVSIADAAKQGMLSRSLSSFERNFRASSAHVEALNDGRGYGAQVGYRGNDGQTLIALIHEDCYVGWTQRELDVLGPIPANHN
jgi:hypothetical protein